MLSPLEYGITQKDPNLPVKKGSNHYNVKQTRLHIDHHFKGYNAKSSHSELQEWLFAFLTAYRSDVS
jgi:hypothetical protein